VRHDALLGMRGGEASGHARERHRRIDDLERQIGHAQDRRVPAPAVADDRDRHAARAGTQVGEKGVRRRHARVEHDPGVGQRLAGRHFPSRREHFSPLSVETRHEQPGLGECLVAEPAVRERVERRHGHHGAVARQREALNGGDADAEPGERSGAGDDREEIDVGDRLAVAREPVGDVVRQPLAVRARGIARRRLAHVAVHQGDAARACDRLERQHEHGAMLYSDGFDPLRAR
jgi:hypothetical protein